MADYDLSTFDLDRLPVTSNLRALELPIRIRRPYPSLRLLSSNDRFIPAPRSKARRRIR